MMTTAISASDPSIALAEHLLDLDNLNDQVDTENLNAARNEEQAALNQQIEKLHEAANDVRKGAWVQGGLSLAGSAAGFGGTALDPGTFATDLKAASPVFSSAAGIFGPLAGAAPQADHEADAKRAEAHVVDARSRADEAEHHRERMEQQSDRTLSSVDSIVNSEAQGNLALIANI
jgi:hypothetical protein